MTFHNPPPLPNIKGMMSVNKLQLFWKPAPQSTPITLTPNHNAPLKMYQQKENKDPSCYKSLSALAQLRNTL